MAISAELAAISAEIAIFTTAMRDRDYALALDQLVIVRVLWVASPDEMERDGKSLRFKSIRDIDTTIAMLNRKANDATASSLGVQSIGMNHSTRPYV